MKERTIEELHDAKIGHRKFAKVCDLLIVNNHDVGQIKEYYEHYKLTVDEKQFWFFKNWKASAKDFVDYVEKLLAMEQQIKQMKER